MDLQETKMPEQQFKRNVAHKLRVGDILIGKPVSNEEKFAFLELGSKKIIRVNIIGNIIDRYESEGERKYLFLTIDDGSGQIKIKIFGDDCSRFKNVFQGQTVAVIGNLRNWNNETYVAPEIIKEQDPRYLLVRKLEAEKERTSGNAGKTQVTTAGKEQIMAIKDKLLELIKSSEEVGGIETPEILRKFVETSPAIVNQEIQRLLEEGIVFEPRPGKIRYLG